MYTPAVARKTARDSLSIFVFNKYVYKPRAREFVIADDFVPTNTVFHSVRVSIRDSNYTPGRVSTIDCKRIWLCEKMFLYLYNSGVGKRAILCP